MVKILAILSVFLLTGCIEAPQPASKRTVDVVVSYTRIDMGPYWFYDFCYDNVRYLAGRDFIREKLDEYGKVVSCK